MTLHKLLADCRELAYEHRVEEAIRALKEAERTRAQEKGYQLNPMFSWFEGSVQSVNEPAKWATRQVFQNLTPQEEYEILGALFCIRLGWRVCRAEDELLAVTLGIDWNWPALDEWFWRFKNARRWPSAWEAFCLGRSDLTDEVYETNLRKPTDPKLATMHRLSLNARRVLLDGWLGWIRAEKSYLRRSDYDKAIDELASAGVVRRGEELPLGFRLSSLPISGVRAIQKKHGVKGATSMEQIVRNLLASVSEETLAAELQSDSYAKLDVGYRQLDRFRFEWFRARLLAKTFDGMMHSYNAYRIFQEEQCDTKLGIFNCGKRECSFCTVAVKNFGKLKHVTPSDLPPFHPGCTCVLRIELK